MVRAAAASSPHIMSLMTSPSLPFSSDRRIGRPTMEGYWNSGKFWRRERGLGGGLVRNGGGGGSVLARRSQL